MCIILFTSLLYTFLAKQSIYFFKGGGVMKAVIPDNLAHIIILDISGIYAQIYNQGYFDPTTVAEIKQQYSDTKRWHVIELNT